MRNVYKSVVIKPGIYRRRWEDKVKMDLKEIKCGLDWVCLMLGSNTQESPHSNVTGSGMAVQC
jgi:hypothetical protein